MANPDILITPGQGTIGFSGTNTGTIQLRVAESGDIHFEGDQGSLLSLSDDLSDSLFSVNDAAGMPVFEVFADDTIKAYRNNEAKLEIDPDNNRIRLRDNTYVSGSLFITGQEAIYLRTSASSTRIRSDNQINFLTEGGSAQMARFKKIQVSTSYSETADFNDNGIVFGTDANLFRSAANTLKTDGNLVVIGDMTVSGDITSASATHEATSYTASTHVSGISGYFGKMGIGYSDNFHPDARLVVGQNPTNGFAIIAGSDNVGVAPQISNSQTKVVRIGMPHYTITEEPVTLMTATSSSSKTDIHIGGGTSYGNSIENMYLRTAANHTTTKGTTALYINNNQEVVVGSLGGLTTAAGLGAALTVSGDTNITGELRVKEGIYVSDGDSLGSAYIQLGNSSDYTNFTSAQLHLAGGTNAGFQADGSRKIFLSDYDNDGANGVTLFECIDENQNVDIKFMGGNSPNGATPGINYFRGSVGIGTDTPRAFFHVQSGTSDNGGTVLRLGGSSNHTSRIQLVESVNGDNDMHYGFTLGAEGGTNGDATNNFIVKHHENSVAGGTAASRAALSVDRASGFVGVGTSDAGDANFRVRGQHGQDALVRINTSNTEKDARLMLGESDTYGMTFEYDGIANIGYLGMNNNVDPTASWSKRIQMSRDGTEVAFMAGNVGIGTTNPSNRLEVRAPNTIAPFKLVNSSNSNRRFLQVSSQSNYSRLTLYNNTEVDTIHLDTNGDSYFKGGNVGIGTDNPARKFMVHGASARMGIKNSTEGVVLGLLSDDAGYFQLNSADGTTQIQLRADAGDSYITGQLGIGTKSPSSTLTVFGDTAGTAKIQIEGEGGADPYINFLVNNTTHWAMGADDSDGDSFKLSQHSALGTDDIFNITTAGTIEIRGAGVLEGNNSRADIVLPDGSGIAIGSAYTFANIYGLGGNLHLRANSRPANTSAESVIHLSTSTDSGGQAGDVVVSGGKVGIGTTNPQSSLHIYQTAPIISLTDSNSFSDANDRFIFRAGTPDGGFFQWYDNSASTTTNLMFIGADGDVGIGTTNPQGAKLHVNGSTIVSGTLYVKNDQIWEDANSTDIIAKLHDNNDDGIFDIYQNNSVVNRIHGNGASYFKGGNVGIGTTSPATGLTVASHMSSSPTAQIYLDVYGGNTNGGGGELIFNTSASAGDLNNYNAIIRGTRSSAGNGSSDLTFLTTNVSVANGPAARMTIKDNGNVGIATTAPTGQLHIYQSGDSQPALLVEGSQGSLFSVEDTLTGSLMSVNDIAGLPVFEAFDDGTIVMGQYNSGDLVVTGNKVGIGTTNPDEQLHVEAAAADILINSTTANQASRLIFKTTSHEYRIGTFGAGDNFWIYDASNAAYRVAIDPNGNVGIGTTNPSARLHVKSASTDSWAVLATASDGSNLGGIYEAGDGAGVLVAKDAGGTNKVYLDGQGSSHINGGNVGIGTTSPDSTLHVHTASAGSVTPPTAADDLVVENSAACGITIISPDANDGGLYFANPSDSEAACLRWNHNADTLILETRNAGASLVFETANTVEAMRINSSQNVGIGTTNPDGKLHIHTASAGSVTADSSVDDLVVENNNHGGISLLVPNDKASAITFGTPGDSIGAKIQWDNTNDAFDITTANNGAFIRFKTDNQTEAMRIDSSQNVGIGTTVPSGRLHVENNSTGIIVANDQITGNAFEVFGAQGNLLTVTDDLSDSLFSVNDAAGMPVFEVFADDTIKSYRNNESKLEIDPDNNRIRLRDNAFVSGNIIASGSVGIGTTGPSAPLHIRKTSLTDNSRNALLLLDGKFVSASVDSSDEIGIAFNVENAGGGWQQTTSITSSYQVNYNTLNLQPAGGNVGIGTTDPDSLLTVDGDAQITGALNVAGNIVAGNYIDVGSRIRHVDDLNTSIDFGFDSIRLQVGGYDLFRVDEDDGDIVFNEDSDLGKSLDIRMESNSKTNMFFLDASEDRIGIGTTQPLADFEVHGIISGVKSYSQHARFEHRNNSHDNGGSSVIGYNTRPFNKTIVNNGGFATTGANTFTLNQGLYYVVAETTQCSAEGFLQLRNNSDSAFINHYRSSETLQSVNVKGSSTSSDYIPHRLQGVFYLGSSKTIELQSFLADPNADDGLGQNIVDSDTDVGPTDYTDDVYAWIEFWKISPTG